MEHSRCFFFSRMEQADSCIQQPMCLYHDHTTHYCHLLNLLFEPYLSNRSRISEANPPKRNEAETRTDPKLLQRFLFGPAPSITAPQGSRCDVSNNGGYKPTLGPFSFAREKKHRECSIRQVTSKISMNLSFGQIRISQNPRVTH